MRVLKTKIKTRVQDERDAARAAIDAARTGVDGFTLQALVDAAVAERLAAIEALAKRWSCNCGGPSPEGHHEPHCWSFFGEWLNAALSTAKEASE